MEPGVFGSVLLGPADQSTQRLRVRIQLLLTVLLVTTNLVGAAIVVILYTLVIPSTPPNHNTVLALKVAVPIYIAVAILIGSLWGTAAGLRPPPLGLRGPDPHRPGAAPGSRGAVVPDQAPGRPVVRRHDPVHPARGARCSPSEP